MEPTTRKPNTAQDWLTIQLAVLRTGDEVSFNIVFTNAGLELQLLPFPRQPRNAEFLGLLVEDAAGQRVRPERKHIGRYGVAPGDQGSWLQPGESWHYNSVGILLDEELDFPATLFHLRRGQVYQIKFVCKQVQSNEVLFIA